MAWSGALWNFQSTQIPLCDLPKDVSHPLCRRATPAATGTVGVQSTAANPVVHHLQHMQKEEVWNDIRHHLCAVWAYMTTALAGCIRSIQLTFPVVPSRSLPDSGEGQRSSAPRPTERRPILAHVLSLNAQQRQSALSPQLYMYILKKQIQYTAKHSKAILKHTQLQRKETITWVLKKGSPPPLWCRMGGIWKI